MKDTNIINLIGGRKFIICIAGMAFMFVLSLYKMVTSDQFIDFLKYIVGFYMASNVIQHTTENIKSKAVIESGSKS